MPTETKKVCMVYTKHPSGLGEEFGPMMFPFDATIEQIDEWLNWKYGDKFVSRGNITVEQVELE